MKIATERRQEKKNKYKTAPINRGSFNIGECQKLFHKYLHFDAFGDGVRAMSNKRHDSVHNGYLPIAYNEARVFNLQKRVFYDRMIGLGVKGDSVHEAHLGMIEVLSSPMIRGVGPQKPFELHNSRRAEVELLCLCYK